MSAAPLPPFRYVTIETKDLVPAWKPILDQPNIELCPAGIGPSKNGSPFPCPISVDMIDCKKIHVRFTTTSARETPIGIAADDNPCYRFPVFSSVDPVLCQVVIVVLLPRTPDCEFGFVRKSPAVFGCIDSLVFLESSHPAHSTESLSLVFARICCFALFTWNLFNGQFGGTPAPAVYRLLVASPACRSAHPVSPHNDQGPHITL